MPMRTCAYCGKPLDANMSPKARYCSDSCRVLACRERRRNGDAGNPDMKKAERSRPSPQPPLNSREFERMMDGSMEDVLRRNRDRLQAALDDPATPATALPAISRQLISVCRELESTAGGDPILDLEDDSTEVNADAGASIV